MKGAKDVREDKECYKVPSIMLVGCDRRFWSKHWRSRYVCALVLLALAVFPVTAYASSFQQGLAGVIQGPSQWYDYGDPADGGYVGYFVYAYSEFDAALYTLDYDPSQLTSEQKAKLSNASTGGKFYEYVQQIQTFGNDEPGGWLSRDFYGQWVTLYGRDYLYWVEATQQQIDAAKTDLQKVMNGEDLGGGSGSGGTGSISDITSISLFPYYSFRAYGITGETNLNYITYNVDSILYTTRMESNGTGYSGGTLLNTLFELKCNGINLSELPNNVIPKSYICELSSNVLVIVAVTSGDYEIQQKTITSDTGVSKTYNYISGTISGYSTTFRVTLSGFTSSGGTLTVNNKIDDWFEVKNITYTYNQRFAGLVTDNGTDIPPTNWPVDPTPTPVEPPEVPEPPTTTPPTQPTPPTSPTPPIYQPQPVYVTSNFTVDLQGILDAMDEHCQHIQNALYQQSKNLYEDFTTYMSDKYADLKLVLDGNFGYIGDTIEDGFEDLENYLWDLFKWLKRNMDFTFTAPEYDDSSVLSWLKKIYSKMGTGIRSKPVDPVVDPVGAWDWLGQLIQNILGALSNAVGGLAGTVGDLFEGIKEKFPFSIPWDLAAILALFDAAPVTPQATIDYTIFEDGPISIPVHWDINMHYLDDTMGTIRAMEDIVFCFYLLLKTDWLSNIFDGIGDYLGGKFRTAVRS